MRATRSAALIGWVVLCAAGAARADLAGGVCPGRFEAAAGPLAGGTEAAQPADFGAVPETCPGSDLSLRLRGELFDGSAAPDFEGRIVATGTVRARRRINARSGISIALDVITYQYVNDAGLAATEASFGPATVGYHLVLASGARAAVAVYARALLPVATARQSGSETGLELGASGRARLSRRWLADGGVSLAGPLVVTGGQAHGQLQPAALAEVWFAPRPAFALFAGGSLRSEVAPTLTLVSVAPRVGMRSALAHGLWMAFLAEAPVAGDDRTNVIASVFVGWEP
ncbi:MAG TPA: hypothetical protein VLA79_12805 [Polyangia bacterium]|nr:hypothetical protein [Polyangia bacterium]